MGFYRSIARLFGRSPFGLLRLHAEKVQETVQEMAKLLNAYAGEESQLVSGEAAERVGELEHEADEIKQEIRSQLPRSLLMPVSRSDILEFLWQQDRIADNCQDAASLLALKRVKLSEEMREKFGELSQAMERAAEGYKHMIAKLSDVLESSFGKRQVNAIITLINELNRLEHEADIAECELVRMVYARDDLDGFSKYHLISIILKVGNVIDHMENAGGRLRIMVSR